jgi:hypothetical protein
MRPTSACPTGCWSSRRRVSSTRRVLPVAALGALLAVPVAAAGPGGHVRVRVTSLAVAAAGSSAQAPTLPGAATCPILPADNPWNQRVDKLPVADGRYYPLPRGVPIEGGPRSSGTAT